MSQYTQNSTSMIELEKLVQQWAEVRGVWFDNAEKEIEAEYGKSPMMSNKFENPSIVSESLTQKSPTASDKFVTEADKLIAQLSFSHIVGFGFL